MAPTGVPLTVAERARVGKARHRERRTRLRDAAKVAGWMTAAVAFIIAGAVALALTLTGRWSW